MQTWRRRKKLLYQCGDQLCKEKGLVVNYTSKIFLLLSTILGIACLGSLFIFALMLILVICEVYHVFTAAVLALSFCVGIRLLNVKDIVSAINLNMMITLVCSFSMAAAVTITLSTNRSNTFVYQSQPMRQ